MPEMDDLIRIDRHLIDVQSKPSGWADYLRSVVSPGFVRRPWDIRTSTQTVEEMIDAIDAEPIPISPVEVTAEHNWQRGSLGVTTTTCTWPGLGADDVQIIRVYTRSSERWRCEYWQETRYHRPRV